MLDNNELANLSPYVDVHCHRRGDVGLSVLSIDGKDFIGQPMSAGYFSLGIHPWFIEQQDWRQSLKAMASCQAVDFVAIGECGLDRAIATPMALQVEVFEQQVVWAEQLAKPLIVHCVRAFDLLLAMKKASKTKQIWIVHGFNGKPRLAEQLWQHGCHLSLGGALLKQDGSQQVLRDIPLLRLFLETDAAKLSISEIYAVAAKIRGIDETELRQCIFENFLRVFSHV